MLFALLDGFNCQSKSILIEQFPPMFQEFLSSQLSDDEDAKRIAVVTFSGRVQALFSELRREQTRINEESNSIRLISSPEIDVILDDLYLAVEQSTNDAFEQIRFMSTPQYWGNEQLLEPYTKRTTESAAGVVHCRERLRKQMKVELEEI